MIIPPALDKVMPPVTLASNEPSVLNLPSGPRGAAAPSLLGGLVIAARHRGIHLSTTQLIRDHQLGSGEVSTAQLIRIAQAAGLRAKATTLRWAALVKMGTALPAIVLLRNGSAMVLLRAESEVQGRPPIVVLQDPTRRTTPD